jgi:hypothetical protein
MTVRVTDNAGGVAKEDLELLVAPGASGSVASRHSIGNFGVGGKRAGIALGQLVEIRTRFGNGPTYGLEISDDWLGQDDTWEIMAFEANEIEAGTTEVRISKVRQGFDLNSISDLEHILSETYAKLVGRNCQIQLNGKAVLRTEFDHWAYPKGFEPVSSTYKFSPDEDSKHNVAVKITAGLISDRDPVEENYGVYFYCNKRLILAHEKSAQVGYYKGGAGVPHPDASLCRVIVELDGPPEMMPWTSNKSGINWSHPTFSQLQSQIIELTKKFTTISRRMKNSKETDVYPHTTGEIIELDLSRDDGLRRVVDIPVPRGRRKNYSDRIVEENQNIIEKNPWTLALVEAMGVADALFRKRIESKNRIALILLDSNLEISMKEYIVNNPRIFPPKDFTDRKLSDLFSRRPNVIEAIKPHVNITDEDWGKISHYYLRRNKMIHERATVDASDREIQDYRSVVERVLKELFGLQL